MLAMVRLIHVRRSLVISSSSMLNFLARRNAIKTNSPHLLSNSISICDTGRPFRNYIQKPVGISALSATIPITMPVIRRDLDFISCRLISNPTVKKNIPTNIPRNGEISVLT